MIRLVMLILVFVVFLFFIVLNLDNKCDIFLGFYRFSEVPVFLSVFFSFILGMIFMAPFAFSLGRGKRKKSAPPKVSSQPPAPGKKKMFSGFGMDGKKKKGEEDTGVIRGGSGAEVTEIKRETVPYGID